MENYLNILNPCMEIDVNGDPYVQGGHLVNFRPHTIIRYKPIRQTKTKNITMTPL